MYWFTSRFYIKWIARNFLIKSGSFVHVFQSLFADSHVFSACEIFTIHISFWLQVLSEQVNLKTALYFFDILDTITEIRFQ